MKTPNCDIVLRWMDLDLMLLKPPSYLNVKKFAEKWDVDERTIRRDINLLRGLEQKIVKVVDSVGRETGNYKYTSEPDDFTECLFTCNLKASHRRI
jgi:predicted DNA-binding transcriptional regulator YafY